MRRPLNRQLVTSVLAPESGVLGQGVRFALAGSLVALVYLLTTTILALVIPFQVALACGFCLALAVHFTLQRFFVWVHREGFALPLRRQAGRYLAIAAAQYGLTAASTSVLPPLLGLPTEVVYLLAFALITATNFVVLRNGIFHAG
ncbi:MAG TPA: GtrA family protein [Solirubrobacteraceae bacterium]|nr:GtrA family protein [Solirubrobacteraceae bacterium]